jgi:hypothetical protein
MSRRISLLALSTLLFGLLAGAAASEPAKTSAALPDPAAQATGVPVATAPASPAPASASPRPAVAPAWLAPAPAATMSPLKAPAQKVVPDSWCSYDCYLAWEQCQAGCNGDTSCLQGCSNDRYCCDLSCDGYFCD